VLFASSRAVEVACSIYCCAVEVARSVYCRAVKAALFASSRAVKVACSIYCRTIEVMRSVYCRAVEAALFASSRAVEVACSIYRRAVEVARSVDCRTVEAALSDSSRAVEKRSLFIVASSTSRAQLIVAPLRPRSLFQVMSRSVLYLLLRRKVARSVYCRAVKAALSDSSRAVEKRDLFIVAPSTSRAQLIVVPLRPRSLFQVVVEVVCSAYRHTVEVVRSVDCRTVEVALIFLFAVTHSSSSSRRIVHCCTVAHIFIVVPMRANLHHCTFIRTEMCSCFQGLYLETENCFPTSRDIILSQSHVH